MRYVLTIFMACVALINPGTSFADQSAHQLGVCLTDALNGKERKLLAKWIFLGMSSHSVIKPYSNASEKDIEDSSRFVGNLVTRLMTEDCPDQTKAAYEESGAQALEHAFGIVGQVAMQELMTEPSVSEALGAFEKYMDQSRFDETFK